ncbi:MAG: glucose-6-phosphate isomerase [Alphaproteobacteria bacterium]|nr:MAG: glucose-6-phosphate isomerase [Alphaproteobacteria bacterium]
MSARKTATRDAWNKLAQHSKAQRRVRITGLFDADPRRVQAMTIALGPLRFDFSKTHADARTLAAFAALYRAVRFADWRRRMLAGAAINESEGRPVLHTALRAAAPPARDDTGGAVAGAVKAQQRHMRRFVTAVHAGKAAAQDGKPYRHVLHLGIGGSALGPDMVVAALKDGTQPKLDVHVVANVDGAALAPVLKRLDPRRTLVVIASKTFTTTETLTNAATVLAWLRKAGIDAPTHQVVGATADPDAAARFGLHRDAIFAFAEWVGGRYSLWSAVGLPIALGLGWPAFAALLAGAAEMDAHFAQARWPRNAPMLAAALDVWYASFWRAETRAVFAYDNRLALLVPYLQQLEMESNGKGVARDGKPVRHSTAPIVWGGVGTDCQHAVFQLLHQGTHLVPTEFIAVRKPDHPWRNHHRQLLANCFAQSAALMQGRTKAEALARLRAAGLKGAGAAALAAAKTFPGNRPSVTVLLERLTPRALGALLAFYEHRTFAAGCLWQINSFDQMGVELGKELAKGLGAVLDGTADAAAMDSSTRALLAALD